MPIDQVKWTQMDDDVMKGNSVDLIFPVNPTSDWSNILSNWLTPETATTVSAISSMSVATTFTATTSTETTEEEGIGLGASLGGALGHLGVDEEADEGGEDERSDVLHFALKKWWRHKNYHNIRRLLLVTTWCIEFDPVTYFCWLGHRKIYFYYPSFHD